MTFVFCGSLLRYVGYRRRWSYDASDLGSALDALFHEHPALRPLMLDEQDELRPGLRLTHRHRPLQGPPDPPLAAEDSVEVTVMLTPKLPRIAAARIR